MGEYRPLIIVVNVVLGIGSILIGVFLIPIFWAPSPSQSFLYCFEKVEGGMRYSDVRKLLWRQPKNLDDQDIDAAADAIRSECPFLWELEGEKCVRHFRLEKWVDPEHTDRWVFVGYIGVTGGHIVAMKGKVGYQD